MLRLNPRTFLIPAALYLCGIALFAVDPFSRSDFPLDDAWIHRVYSRSFAFGQGFAYNDGMQEAGATSPLWAILSSPAHWLEPLSTEAVVGAVKFLGVLLGLISVAAVFQLGSRITDSRVVGTVAASLFALEPRSLFSALSGMETLLLIALWLWAAYASITKRWLLASVLFGLGPVARPEAVVVLSLWLLGLSVLAARGERDLRRLTIWIVPWPPMLLWALFCKFTTGHWLPNTYYLKAEPLDLGPEKLTLAWQSLSQHGLASLPIFAFGLAAFIGWTLWRGNLVTRFSFLLLTLAPIAYLLGIVSTRRLSLAGYYWTRWTDPASLVLTVAFCIGYAIIISAPLSRTSRVPGSLEAAPRYRVAALLLMGLGAVGVLYSTPGFLYTFLERRHHLASDSRAIHLVNVRTGVWVNHNTPAEATVAVNDAGAIRYFGRRRTMDLPGLNNADLAFGKKTSQQALDEAGWFAIFPAWYRKSNLLGYLQPQVSFSVPPEEYTVCNCPGQSTKVVFTKRQDRTDINPQELLGRGSGNAVSVQAARAALVAVLRSEPTGSPVWFGVSEGDIGALALLAELRPAFAEAGWRVEATQVVPFAIRPGVEVLAAEATPPRYVMTAEQALLAAGLLPRSGTNYRDHFEEMSRQQPDFEGFELEPEQTYLIVLGGVN